MFLALLLLEQFDKSLYYRLLVRIVLLGLGPESIFGFFLCKFDFSIGARCASVHYLYATLGGVCTKLTHIHARSSGHGGTTKLPSSMLRNQLGKDLSLLGSSTGLTTGFINGHSRSTESLALGKESFSGVSLDNQFFMFIAKLIPQRMEITIVWSMYNMT